MSRTVRRVVAVLTLLVPVLVGLAPMASADPTGRIVQITQTQQGLQVVFVGNDLPQGTSIDPASVTADLAGSAVTARAHAVTAQDKPVRRTAMLVLDVSGSMKGRGIEGAQAAAKDFVSALPADVEVGLITFSDKASVALRPTTDRLVLTTLIGGLTASGNTALYDATVLAVRTLPPTGVRSVVLLTDGENDATSPTTLTEAAAAVRSSRVSLTAVSFGTKPKQVTALRTLADNGAGGVVATEQASGLAAAFRQAAREIGNQIVVEVAVPQTLAASAGNLSITARAGDTDLRATAYVNLARAAPRATASTAPLQPVTLGSGAPRGWLVAGLAALFVALALIVAFALGGLTRQQRPEERIRRRLSIYTITGRQPKVVQETTATRLGDNAVARSAVELADRVVKRRDLEAVLGWRLEAGGIPLRASEWMLLHVGTAVTLALLFYLLTAGRLVAGFIGLLIGLAGPWMYLTIKQSRREAAFHSQLPDTLQLLSGSLQAGYSLPQALDTVVREGTEPVSGEFNRALVETRLGVPVEDALDGVADRVNSKDFGWVVMAIKVQREVGGNLAEVLSTVAETLRERDRLRRQVKALSAEGRLSAWILGLLPVVFTVYLVLVRPDYLRPLYTDVLGIVAVCCGLVLLAVGAVWLRKVVTVEV